MVGLVESRRASRVVASVDAVDHSALLCEERLEHERLLVRLAVAHVGRRIEKELDAVRYEARRIVDERESAHRSVVRAAPVLVDEAELAVPARHALARLDALGDPQSAETVEVRAERTDEIGFDELSGGALLPFVRLAYDADLASVRRKDADLVEIAVRYGEAAFVEVHAKAHAPLHAARGEEQPLPASVGAEEHDVAGLRKRIEFSVAVGQRGEALGSAALKHLARLRIGDDKRVARHEGPQPAVRKRERGLVLGKPPVLRFNHGVGRALLVLERYELAVCQSVAREKHDVLPCAPGKAVGVLVVECAVNEFVSIRPHHLALVRD